MATDAANKRDFSNVPSDLFGSAVHTNIAEGKVVSRLGCNLV